MQQGTATAIILAGGTGSRMGNSVVPKQFLPIQGKPVLVHTLQVFEICPRVDKLLVVVSRDWETEVEAWVKKYGLSKFFGFAQPGATRQASIYNGLEKLSEVLAEKDAILVHDAVRPFVEQELLTRVLDGLDEADGSMPALRVTDTVYSSRDGEYISGLLKRSELFAGQTPEAYRFGAFWKAFQNSTAEDLATVSGSSEMAFRHGMRVKIVAGSMNNLKLTIPSDFERIQSHWDLIHGDSRKAGI